MSVWPVRFPTDWDCLRLITVQLLRWHDVEIKHRTFNHSLYIQACMHVIPRRLNWALCQQYWFSDTFSHFLASLWHLCPVIDLTVQRGITYTHSQTHMKRETKILQNPLVIWCQYKSTSLTSITWHIWVKLGKCMMVLLFMYNWLGCVHTLVLH